MTQEQRSEFPQGHAAGSKNALLAEALTYLVSDYEDSRGSDMTGTGIIARIRVALAPKHPQFEVGRVEGFRFHTSGLARYKCHKEVRAAKIIAFDDAVLEINGGIISVTAEYMDKHQPHVGGYYVVYDDGYQSFSPAASFESGYTLMPKPVAFGPIFSCRCSLSDRALCLDKNRCTPPATAGQVTLP